MSGLIPRANRIPENQTCGVSGVSRRDRLFRVRTVRLEGVLEYWARQFSVWSFVEDSVAGGSTVASEIAKRRAGPGAGHKIRIISYAIPREKTFQSTNFVSANRPVVAVTNAPNVIRMRFPGYFAYIRAQRASWYLNGNIL